MTDSRRFRVERWLSAGRAAFAIGLLTRPGRLAGAASLGGPLPPTWLIRLLGARMLVQSGLELVDTDRPVTELGVAVDAVHAASMLAVASRSRHYRRVTLASAVAATASAGVGLVVLRRAR